MLEKLTNLEKLDQETKSKILGGRNCLRPCVERCAGSNASGTATAANVASNGRETGSGPSTALPVG